MCWALISNNSKLPSRGEEFPELTELRQAQFTQLFRRRPTLAIPAADLVVFIQHRRQVHHVAFACAFGERLAGDARWQAVISPGHASGIVEQPLQVLDPLANLEHVLRPIDGFASGFTNHGDQVFARVHVEGREQTDPRSIHERSGILQDR